MYGLFSLILKIIMSLFWPPFMPHLSNVLDRAMSGESELTCAQK